MNREERWLLEEKFKGEENSSFFTDCQLLETGVPLAYLIGHVPFLGTTIYLDSKPLIPRPETEFWVEKAIAEIQSSAIPNPRILDLCAGSGCIGVAILDAVPKATVDFIEIDNAHIPTIKKNCDANGVQAHRYNIIESDLFSSSSDLELPYDFILTNPPYIDASLEHTDTSVINHEPHLALFGGEKGLALITRILTDTRKYLKPTGFMYLEHETEHTEALQKLGKLYGLSIVTHTDQYGVARYSRITVAQ